jgi:hypothetical protein
MQRDNRSRSNSSIRSNNSSDVDTSDEFDSEFGFSPDINSDENDRNEDDVQVNT